MTLPRFSRLNWIRTAMVSMAAASVVAPAHAIDTDPGDWTAPPPGTNLLLVYAQHADRDSLYIDGQKASNAKLVSDVTILRYVRPIEVSGLVVAPQVLLPWAGLSAGGVSKGLGSAAGVGDLILASPVWFAKADAVSRSSFAIAPYLVLPTGDYQKGRALNIGENRWSAILQLGATYQLSTQVDAEGAIDVTVFGKNKEAGVGADVLEQEAIYQAQGSLNWHQSPGTLFAVGISHSMGGHKKLNGVTLMDRMERTKIALTASKFVTPTVQILGTVGRDLKVDNGFKESSRFNLRILKVF